MLVFVRIPGPVRLIVEGINTVMCAGLNRCGKSCRLRWTNYLRPDLKHESFTPEEEQLIIDFHKAIGSRLTSYITLL